jgi:hypothetical protein
MNVKLVRQLSFLKAINHKLSSKVSFAWRNGIQRVFLNCLALEDGTDRVSRNVGNYQSTLRNIPEE